MTPVLIAGLFRSAGHNFVGHFGREPGTNPMESVKWVHVKAGRGVEGDRFMDHADGYKGQVTFFSIETHREVCVALGTRLEPWAWRRNVVVEGVDLNAWIGRQFRVDDVGFEGVEECRPCAWMDRVAGAGAEALLRGRGGLRARVLTDGLLKVGPAAWGGPVPEAGDTA